MLKRVVAMLLAVIMVGALAACGAQEKPAAETPKAETSKVETPAEKETITIQIWGTETEYKERHDAFMAKNPEWADKINIEYVSAGDHDSDQGTKFRLQISSGEMPDVILLQYSQAKEFAAQEGVLLDIGPYVESYIPELIDGVSDMKACFEKRGAVYPYAELSTMAAQEPQFRSTVDLATPSFALDGNDVLALMAQQLKERHMAVPENDAQWVRLFFNSLTAKVCQIMDFLKSGFGKSFDDIVIINGGSLHSALMQQIADASGLPVKAGIRYASLYGNVLNQLLAMGEVASPEEMRQVAAASLRFAEYEPRR